MDYTVYEPGENPVTVSGVKGVDVNDGVLRFWADSHRDVVVAIFKHWGRIEKCGREDRPQCDDILTVEFDGKKITGTIDGTSGTGQTADWWYLLK